MTVIVQSRVFKRGKNPWRMHPSKLKTPTTGEKWLATTRSLENSSQLSGGNLASIAGSPEAAAAIIWRRRRIRISRRNPLHLPVKSNQLGRAR